MKKVIIFIIVLTVSGYIFTSEAQQVNQATPPGVASTPQVDPRIVKVEPQDKQALKDSLTEVEILTIKLESARKSWQLNVVLAQKKYKCLDCQLLDSFDFQRPEPAKELPKEQAKPKP